MLGPQPVSGAEIRVVPAADDVFDAVAVDGCVPADPPAAVYVAVVFAVEDEDGGEDRDVAEHARPPQVPPASAVGDAEESQKVVDEPHARKVALEVSASGATHGCSSGGSHDDSYHLAARVPLVADVDVDEVAAIVHDVALSAVLPRWRTLVSGDVEEKSPDELVTSVDRSAEALLTERLMGVLPEAVVVGEEAAAIDRSLLAAVAVAPRVWLVDPLDGTTNFVNGSPDFAVMVALVENGVTIGSWIDCPATSRAFVAARGAGAFAEDGRQLKVSAPAGLSQLSGAALTRFLDDDQRDSIARFGDTIRTLGPGRVCAGIDYALVADGAQDFVLFWRTLPWDHAAGALLVTEAGGVVAHLGGAPYEPATARAGLVAATDESTHAAVAGVILPR